MPRMRILNTAETILRLFPIRHGCGTGPAQPGEPDRVPSNQRLQDNTGVLPPKSALRIIPENWEPPNR